MQCNCVQNAKTLLVVRVCAHSPWKQRPAAKAIGGRVFQRRQTQPRHALRRRNAARAADNDDKRTRVVFVLVFHLCLYRPPPHVVYCVVLRRRQWRSLSRHCNRNCDCNWGRFGFGRFGFQQQAATLMTLHAREPAKSQQAAACYRRRNSQHGDQKQLRLKD